jgi:hypothetical protein
MRQLMADCIALAAMAALASAVLGAALPEPNFAPALPAPKFPAPKKKEARKKTCPCSPACVCGCNEGGPCRCEVRVAPVIIRPAQLPAMGSCVK